eukprot:c53683_g1_i1 orf=62-1657(-)
MEVKQFLQESILLALIFSCFSIQCLAVLPTDTILLWPMPASVSSGSTTFSLSTNFRFSTTASGHSSATLSEAFDRYSEIIFSPYRSHNGSSWIAEQTLQSLVVHVESSNERLQYGADESYILQIPHPDIPHSAYVEAKTVYGALRGLETFSQVCTFNFTTQTVEVPKAPWNISDQPRFLYRGLLIDTARHYQPVTVIKKVIDAMAYAKLNVLHWHIVDTQSFPLEIPSYPRLWDGAYSESERYTIDDAFDIVQYAQRRGIHVMAELDSPGHAQSWGVGYPKLWPSPNCTQPLDPSDEFVYQVIGGVLSDFSKVFTFDFVHMGGDEVDTDCWSKTPHVREWLERNNLTEFGAYKDFVLKVERITLAHGYIPVNWEEPFDNFGDQLNKKTIIHNWLQAGVAPKIVKAGFRCIVSDQDVWYLDHLDVTWEQFYMNEPLKGIDDPKEQQLVIGGEVCMWGETVDASDIEQTIWPRAAAAAERLWTAVTQTPADPALALPRLQYFRCLLNHRGVAAAPVLVGGREAPQGPGSCYAQ